MKLVRETTSLLSGARSVALDVTTKRVKYSFMSVIGERWKPLRAMALLDIVYLDQDLRVMRGQTSTNTIFILVREDA
ncbi:hypothetical protein JKP88DRAFT_287497 [Tribonema minus]|uniref:Uncharacterized protein n=1 Tax=Tribonema minus TaxID=303371 RepID=A0A835Z721_9STRA|nr:hypothetical protein JKP88DRAFT_287497 [Tribonema minus]